MAATSYQYLYYPTDDIVSRFKPSLSAYFDVFINTGFGIVSNADINFLAHEAVLPGTSYQTTDVFGDRQGVTETFANKRVFSPVSVSFYVDYDYKVLEYFNTWFNTISPNLGSTGRPTYKFSYPRGNSAGYKKEIIITKFERNFRKADQRLVEGGVYNYPENRCTYTLRNAYPTDISSVPVSYDSSTILRVSVTFNYDTYDFSRTGDYSPNTSGPGGDTPPSNSVAGTFKPVPGAPSENARFSAPPTVTPLRRNPTRGEVLGQF